MIVHGYIRHNSVCCIPRDIIQLFVKFYFYHNYLDFNGLQYEFKIGDKLLIQSPSSTACGIYNAKRICDSHSFNIKVINFGEYYPNEINYFVNNELKIMSKLYHPNIINMHEIYASNSHLCIVYEALNISLFDIIIQHKHSQMKEETAAILFKQLLSALSYIHELKIVHRNINVESSLKLVVASNRLKYIKSSMRKNVKLKLTDFDHARKVNNYGYLEDNKLVGMAKYIAPEILNGEKYSTQSDLWSVGVVLYTMLCGYPPFIYDNNFEILFNKIKHGKYNMKSKQWMNISIYAKDLVARLLQINPNNRYTAKQASTHCWLN